VVVGRHLLKALTSERAAVASVEPAYVTELFDFYAPMYDQHMKEGLLYTAPRILRQEVRKVVNRTLVEQGAGKLTMIIGVLVIVMSLLEAGKLLAGTPLVSPHPDRDLHGARRSEDLSGG
jgi:hypothetical protein